MFLLAAAVLSFLPALLWLALFWSRDRDYREPVSFILGLFAAGALVAASARSTTNASPAANASLNSVLTTEGESTASAPCAA